MNEKTIYQQQQQQQQLSDSNNILESKFSNNHFKPRVYDDLYDDTTTGSITTTTASSSSSSSTEVKQQQQQNIKLKKKKNNFKKKKDNKNVTIVNNTSSISNSSSNNNNNSKNKNNKNNNNNNNLKKKNIIKHYATYKLFSPFHRMLSLNVLPSLDELQTEFYHLLEMEGCQSLQTEIKTFIRQPNYKEKSADQMLQPLQHFHTSADLDQLAFRDDRNRIETIVRKICGFLKKETNMVLVELILMSIGISKSIEILKLALDIENRGGIFIKVKIDENNIDINNNINNQNNDTLMTDINNSNNNNNLVVTRRKTIGGIFFKLAMMAIPEDMKRKVFSLTVLQRYKRERGSKGKGTFTEITNFIQLPSIDSIMNNQSEINDLDDEFDKLLNLKE
ncbi:hypothetical protein PPL_06168 [Heterostelium album PN500]|uniref:Uncharacterized protein n=1 Tax=Heterostelium pallidum (strain ATCC 26659 / Pp 5 / PN500) TaxID=670386 RepID=D3BCE3_HETP5|nr:hypothetical protein PPL_06168 [Heterostelium album PN500]EFA80933.1 hypothetical protein PPL_06168 [Heterostelium album PN500]|eukprot:XP_020433051.1 hypothetical protein PPL_06168 [Heterostelium album PN500]